MNCEELEPWISAFQDNELDLRRRRIVEAHLACCPDCRALCDEWADLARDVRTSLSRMETPDNLHARVMRQIPEPVVGSTRRSPVIRRQGWLSFALAPAAAAAGWLLWGMRPAPTAPLTVPKIAAAARPPETASAGAGLANTLQAALSGGPFPSSLARMLPAKPGAGEHSGTPGHPKAVPSATLQPGKIQGHRPLESEAVRRLRRLRPRRTRYPLAEYRPSEGRRARRRHAWQIIAERPQPPPLETARPKPVASPQIRVVEYVLPAVQPPTAAPDAGSEYVLRPTQPAQGVETGVDL